MTEDRSIGGVTMSVFVWILLVVAMNASMSDATSWTTTMTNHWWNQIKNSTTSRSRLDQQFSNTDKTSTSDTTTMLVVMMLILLFNIVYVYYQRSTMEQRYGMKVMLHPPEGPSWPFLGQALNFLRYRPWDLLAAWHKRYGEIVCFPLVGATMFSIASPSLCKQVLQSKIASVKKDIGNTMKPFLVILGTGIVTSEDDSWMKQRLKMSHPLRRDVLDMIPTQTLLAVQRFMERLDQASQTHQAIPIGSSLRHLTLQVISGTFLSLSAEESDSTFAKMYLPIVDESNARVWHPYRSYCIFLPSFWKQWYHVSRLNAYVSSLIRQRWELRRRERENEHTMSGITTSTTNHLGRPVDILDGVLQAHEKELMATNGCIEKLTEAAVRQIRDEMKTFMLAGHETSAAMMTWALYELIGDDVLMQRMNQEAVQVFGENRDWSKAKPSDLPHADQLAQLIFSDATLRESLRKYSVVPIVARRTIEDLTLSEKYHLPKGSSILINIQAVHHNPELWPAPMKFDPDRFINKEIAPFTFLPFIAGPRNCLGQYLALLESKMVISMLTQRYKFTLPKGETVQVMDWETSDPRHRYMVPVIPQKELMVQVELKR